MSAGWNYHTNKYMHMYIFVYNRMISCEYKKDMPSNLVGKLSPRV